MKQLVLTFFAAILIYSLFFDDKPETPAINYIYDDALIPPHPFFMLDTLNGYICYHNPFEVGYPFDGYAALPNRKIWIGK